MARDVDESTLRVFLGKLSAAEIIGSFIAILRTIYDTDERFHEITQHIVKTVQVLEVQRGNSDLRSYEEERQKQLFLALLKEQTKREWKRERIFETLFKDWKDSGLTFNQWLNEIKP